MAPNALTRGLISRVSNELASRSKVASEQLPGSKGGEAQNQLQTYSTEIYSYFTRSSAETQLLYSAENWVRIKLALQTAGPVAVGTKASLAPALSGRGILLDPDVPFEAYLAKGTRFYITSETVNRINVTIEPVPWLEQLDQDTVTTQTSVRNAIVSIGAGIVDAINALRGIGAGVGAGNAASSSGNTARQLAQGAGPRVGGVPRLTDLVMPRNIPRRR